MEEVKVAPDVLVVEVTEENVVELDKQRSVEGEAAEKEAERADEKEKEEERENPEENPIPEAESKIESSSDSSSDESSSGEEEDAGEFMASLMRRREGEEEAKSTAFDADEESDDFMDTLHKEVGTMEEGALDDDGAITTGPPRTANEIVEHVESIDLPLTIPEDADTVLAGRISVLVENDVLIMAAEYTKTWDVDSLLCLPDRSVLGRVVELIGRVDRPSYRVIISTSPPKSSNKFGGQNNNSKSKRNAPSSQKTQPTSNTSNNDANVEVSNITSSTTDPNETKMEVTEDSKIETSDPSNMDVEKQDGLSLPKDSTNEESKPDIALTETLFEGEVAQEIEEKENDVNLASTESSEVNNVPKDEESSIKPIREEDKAKEEEEREREERKAKAAAEFYERRKELRNRLKVGDIVLCCVDMSKEVDHIAVRTKGSDASNAWDEEVADDELDFSDDEEERKHREKLKLERKINRQQQQQNKEANGEGNVSKQKSSNPPYPKRQKV